MSPNYHDLRVCIPNSEPSIGGTSATDVDFAHKGIDWDAGNFFIIPSVKMVNKKTNKK